MADDAIDVDGHLASVRKARADDGERTSLCDECGRRITEGPDGTEYGHSRGRRTNERCSRRPSSVDPIRYQNRFTDSKIRTDGGREPVGSTGGGRRAPIMQPDDEPPADSHWCETVGARRYCPRADCPACESDEEGENGD